MKPSNENEASGLARKRKSDGEENAGKEILVHPPYIDYANRTDDEIQRELDRTPVPDHFPTTLHKALENAESYGYSNIISWRPHGRSFCIHQKDNFTQKIMPVFFPSQGQYASFHRQLNSYGFMRLTKKGPDRDSFYHPLFLRSRPMLSCFILRCKPTSNKVRRVLDPDTEPDFSLYMPLPPTLLGADDQHPGHVNPAQRDERIQLPATVSSSAGLATQGVITASHFALNPDQQLERIHLPASVSSSAGLTAQGDMNASTFVLSPDPQVERMHLPTSVSSFAGVATQGSMNASNFDLNPDQQVERMHLPDSVSSSAGLAAQGGMNASNFAFHGAPTMRSQNDLHMHPYSQRIPPSHPGFELLDDFLTLDMALSPQHVMNAQVPIRRTEHTANDFKDDDDESLMSLSSNYDDCAPFLEDVDLSSSS